MRRANGQFEPVSFDERFWSKVAIPADVITGCWIWTGRTSPKGGHGRFGFRAGRSTISTAAHRAAWGTINGPVQPGLLVLHNCPGGDNPACVNPAHLWLGTQAENIADMDRKGRRVAASLEVRRALGLRPDNLAKLRAMAEQNRGKPCSPETRARISAASRARRSN